MMSQTAVVLGLALGVPAPTPVSTAKDEKVYEIVETQSVQISGIDDLIIRIGDQPSLIVSEARDRFDTITVKTTPKELRIRASDKSWFSRRDYSAVLTLPALERLSLAGSIEGDVSGVRAGTLTLDLAGSVDLTISGLCETLIIDAAGSIDLRAFGLLCGDVRIDAAGATDIFVHASQALDVDAAGANDIRYSGNPERISTDLAGAGSVEPAPKREESSTRGL